MYKDKLNEQLFIMVTASVCVLVQSIMAPSCIWCSPGRGDNELRVFVGNQVTLVFWVLHCHLLAEDEREIKSIKGKVHSKAQNNTKKQKMRGDTSDF